jgi:hypothetical protein
MDANPQDILPHLLSAGILKEENCSSMFQKMFQEMRKSAPNLTKAYDSLSVEQKKTMGIAIF